MLLKPPLLLMILRTNLIRFSLLHRSGLIGIFIATLFLTSIIILSYLSLKIFDRYL